MYRSTSDEHPADDEEESRLSVAISPEFLNFSGPLNSKFTRVTSIVTIFKTNSSSENLAQPKS